MLSDNLYLENIHEHVHDEDKIVSLFCGEKLYQGACILKLYDSHLCMVMFINAMDTAVIFRQFVL